MAVTRKTGRDIRDDSIGRQDLNETIKGMAVIKKLVAGPGVFLDSTGVDEGTGDVTISFNPNGTIKQYVHEQSTPSDTWTMYHEFGGYPDVVLLDADGEKVDTDLFYPDSNTVVAVFSSPLAGTAALTINQLTQEHFVQTEASDTWTVNHGLGRYPSVIAFDTADGHLRVYGDVRYPSLDTLVVSFSYPLVGELYLV